MCGAKPVRRIGAAFGRGLTAVYTLGGSEIARNNLSGKNVVNQILQAPERTYANIGEGVDKAGAAAFENYPMENPPPPPAPPEEPIDPGPTPQFTPANPTESAALRRRRRLSSMRAGLASTVLTGSRGDTSTPNLLQPTASGTTGGGKTKLGQ